MSIQKTITPIDNSVYLERPLSTEAEIDKVIESSKKSFQSWKNTSIEDRITIINKFIDNLIALKPEVSKEICWQIGRPISQCGNELRGFEERSRHMVKIAKDSLQNIPATKNDEFDNYIKKEPLGTIFVIAPWNYPFNTSVNSIVPSLLAGNAVILKHSSQTPLCAEELYEAAKQSSLPKNIFQYLHLDHDQTSRIISDSRINHVLFTGSVSGGKKIKKSIGTRVIGAGL